VERSSLEPGAEIGGYTVVAPLGSGGMGTVYRAVDDGGNDVALKLLHPDPADSTARPRLMREVAALQRLHHPAVAAVLDAETDSADAFLVTEFVEGTDLERLVTEQGAFGPTELLALADGLRAALRAIHSAGVVHRDLKPANVVMTVDGPVLIDFGLAQGEADPRLTSAGMVAGTPGYIAPELLDGDDPAESADWWGWAASLVFAATGRPPFGRGRATTVIARARAGKPDLTGLREPTRTALRGALAADKAERTAPDDVVVALTTAATERDRLPSGAGDDDGETTLLAGADAVGTTMLKGADAVGTRAMAGGLAGTATAPAALAPTAVASASIAPAGIAPAAFAAAAGGAAAAALASNGRSPASLVPSHDGHTRMVATGRAPDAVAPYPTVIDVRTDSAVLPDSIPVGGGYEETDEDWGDEGDDDPQFQAVEWIEDDLDASSGPPTGEIGYVRPSVPGRWVSQIALAALVVVCGARWPGMTLEVVLAFFVAARAYGSTVEAMHGRREKHGVRRSDPWVTLATTPWHVIRAVIGIIPSLLISAVSVAIVVGIGWWLVGKGRWAIGDNVPGQEFTGTTASWLIGSVVLLAVLLLWFGPASRMTRVGTRRLLEAISPRRLGALLLVLVILAFAWAVTTRVLHGGPLDWKPLPVPTVPEG
jgi:hypothetical protein